MKWLIAADGARGPRLRRFGTYNALWHLRIQQSLSNAHLWVQDLLILTKPSTVHYRKATGCSFRALTGVLEGALLLLVPAPPSEELWVQ